MRLAVVTGLLLLAAGATVAAYFGVADQIANIFKVTAGALIVATIAGSIGGGVRLSEARPARRLHPKIRSVI